MFASKTKVAILATVIGVVLVAGIAAAVTFGGAGPAHSAAAPNKGVTSRYRVAHKLLR